MKQNKAPRPINISLLGADAVVACAQVNAQLLQKFLEAVKVKIPVVARMTVKAGSSVKF